ncbi:hypothetical protein B0H14DRAFT_3491451 [Mycena olivaceomarginata]|nr:hypothetical protein B0H14DRAFT_3491451 [Mycena olivaceomarginata]
MTDDDAKLGTALANMRYGACTHLTLLTSKVEPHFLDISTYANATSEVPKSSAFSDYVWDRADCGLGPPQVNVERRNVLSLFGLCIVPEIDKTWVRVVAKTPTAVATEHSSAPSGSRPWWVVFVGREPGLYSTIEAADAQIKGCPNQQYRRKADKVEALNFYVQKYNEGAVEKWVELTEDMGSLNLHH